MRAGVVALAVAIALSNVLFFLVVPTGRNNNTAQNRDLAAAARLHALKRQSEIQSVPWRAHKKARRKPFDSEESEVESVPGTEVLIDWDHIEPAGRIRLVSEPDLFRKSPGVKVLRWTGNVWLGQTNKVPGYLGSFVSEPDCGLPCEFTNDRSKLDEVDAVTFDVQPLAGYGNDFVKRPPQFPARRAGQYFVNSGYEQPHYFHLYAHPGYLVHFDIGMTYDHSGRVPITFWCDWGGLGNLSALQGAQDPPAAEREDATAWFGTNCGGIGGHFVRTEWVRQLMQQLNISSYGKCHHNRDLPPEMQFKIYSAHGKSMGNKVTILKRHKFALTIENNNITDYVTEKLWNAFQSNALPIYLGAPNIRDWLPDPEKSIINVHDFKDIPSLVAYVKRVAADPKLYASYFEWKERPLPANFVGYYNRCAYYNSECRLCQKVAEMREAEADMSSTANQASVASAVIPDRIRRPRSARWALTLGDGRHMRVDDYRIGDVHSSVGAWINPNSPKDMTIASTGDGLHAGGLNLRVVAINDKLQLKFCMRGSCAVSARFVPLDTWTWVGAVFNQSHVALFWNSHVEYFLSTKTVSDVAMRSPIASLCVGATCVSDGIDNSFSGVLDDISIWQRALSKVEMRRLSFLIPRGNERGLVGYWNFDEADSESTFSILGSRVDDGSRFAHHGKIAGAAAGRSSATKCETKPLVLPNVKKSWQNVHEQHFADYD